MFLVVFMQSSCTSLKPTVLDSMIHCAYLGFQLERERGSYLFHSRLLQYVFVFWIGIISDKIKHQVTWKSGTVGESCKIVNHFKIVTYFLDSLCCSFQRLAILHGDCWMGNCCVLWFWAIVSDLFCILFPIHLCFHSFVLDRATYCSLEKCISVKSIS